MDGALCTAENESSSVLSDIGVICSTAVSGVSTLLITTILCSDSGYTFLAPIVEILSMEMGMDLIYLLRCNSQTCRKVLEAMDKVGTNYIPTYMKEIT